MSVVFVSGANGFIAQHIISQLLAEGYQVIGTVRSQAKADLLTGLFNNKNLTLEIVHDLAAAGAFDDIFRKHASIIKYVIHTASPCHYNSVDFESEMLIPAVNGTKSILEAIKKFGAKSIKKVVYTSSFAAICNVRNAYDENLILNEDSWNNDTWEEAKIDAKTAYYGSKAFAEKAAWTFVRTNKDDISFSLTTVNPCYVFGPQLFDEMVFPRLNASCENINAIINANPDEKVDQHFASLFIDVRDVAKAHILAIQSDKFSGKRLLLANTKFALQDIVDSINTNFPDLRGKIPSGLVGNGREVVKHIATLDNSSSRELLSFEFIPFDETVKDTVSQLLKKSSRYTA